MPNGAHASKLELRQSIAARLKAFPPEELATKSQTIRDRLQSLPFCRDAGLILSYSALPDEVNVAGATDCQTAYPRIVDNDLQAWLPEPGAALMQGSWKIPEPLEECAKLISPEDIDIVLVPGRAFQVNGARLGRGKGFYDRFLAQPRLQATKVGVCFTAQIAESIPADPWDVPMDWIVHESGVIELQMFRRDSQRFSRNPKT